MAEQTTTILKDLGGGLVMRRGTSPDAERLGDFNGSIHSNDPHEAASIKSWTCDLAQKPHPTFSPGDYLLVEDLASGKLVSCLNTISQTWSFDGIPFGVGRPELVGTDPAYRSRGLVRSMFEVIHDWSNQRGELVQVITGIPYFYRQFGYEMGIDLSGGRAGFEQHLPKLEDDQEEPYRFRPVAEADLPFIMRLYELEGQRSAVYVVRDQAMWQYELFGKSTDNVNRVEARIIETKEGRPVGYLFMPWYVWGDMQVATGYALDTGVSYLAVSPSVIRYLWQVGQENAGKLERKLKAFGFWLGIEHPVYQAMAERLVFQRRPYAYFVRVPDLPAFLTHIAPALEKRLNNSYCAGHTGMLKISFYRDGLCMTFEDGHLKSVEAWRPKIREDEGMVAFPALTFLQVLFGYRSLDEIRHAYADCWANPEGRALIDALFPKRSSSAWPVS